MKNAPTTRTVRIASILLATAAAFAAGGAHALDNGGFMKVADSTGNTTATQTPAYTGAATPGRIDGDKEKMPAATTGAKMENKVENGADNAKQVVTDSALTTKIKSKLLATKDLKSTGIHVKTKDRVVNLTGSVPTKAEHELALDAVRSVEGVDSVKDHLKVSSR
ncbi:MULTISPECIES: BON domain-containing protein [unclassified Cupriavidus]|uniref:BON domain-containing protein n=1 Tax=unclassified Cupriavidus TaxID=2640874 RepID=UPI0010F656DB|nr:MULTISPECIES: BON domain-containing protein [unclassified Cupriavidus]MWL90194.1 BON domain-containing protein [Cupriavidus sp. SW-Y-13]